MDKLCKLRWRLTIIGYKVEAVKSGWLMGLRQKQFVVIGTEKGCWDRGYYCQNQEALKEKGGRWGNDNKYNENKNTKTNDEQNKQLNKTEILHTFHMHLASKHWKIWKSDWLWDDFWRVMLWTCLRACVGKTTILYKKWLEGINLIKLN